MIEITLFCIDSNALNAQVQRRNSERSHVTIWV